MNTYLFLHLINEVYLHGGEKLHRTSIMFRHLHSPTWCIIWAFYFVMTIIACTCMHKLVLHWFCHSYLCFVFLYCFYWEGRFPGLIEYALFLDNFTGVLALRRELLFSLLGGSCKFILVRLYIVLSEPGRAKSINVVQAVHSSFRRQQESAIWLGV